MLRSDTLPCAVVDGHYGDEWNVLLVKEIPSVQITGEPCSAYTYHDVLSTLR